MAALFFASLRWLRKGELNEPTSAPEPLKTLTELAEQFDIHPNQITQWKTQLLEGAAGVFGEARTEPAAAAVDL